MDLVWIKNYFSDKNWLAPCYSCLVLQVVIFVKSVQRCIALAQLLVEQNFPAIAIHRAMPQDERLARYQQFKDFQRRILVATNLFGRGMDIERVNIAFNYDMPEDSDTYLHRVGADHVMLFYCDIVQKLY